jgi:hypothetical protein
MLVTNASVAGLASGQGFPERAHETTFCAHPFPTESRTCGKEAEDKSNHDPAGHDPV